MSNDLNTKSNIAPVPGIRKLTVSEKIADKIGEYVSPSRKDESKERLYKLTPEQKIQLQEIEDKTISTFTGSIDELESALGVLRIGHHVGWRVLYVAHSKKTIRKYEDILGIKIRELFAEKGPSADRSIGLALAEKFTNFWKVVSGDIKIENRKKIE